MQWWPANWEGQAGCLLTALVLSLPATEATARAGTQPAKPILKDAHGDPLPPGARARLGTIRLRHDESVGLLTFSPDGTILAAGDGRGRVRLWDVGTGRQRTVLEVGDRADDVCHLAFSPDGRILGIGGQDPPVHLCNLVTGKSIRVLAPSKTSRGAPTFTFSPDSKLVATWDSDYVVRLWEVSTGKELSSFRPQVGGYLSKDLVFTPDGPAVIAEGHNARVRVYNAKSGRLIRNLHGCAYPPGALAVSPSGKLLATCGAPAACEACLWDLATGDEPRRLAGYKIAVIAVAFSRDGKSLSALSCDGDYRLWEVATGKERRRSPLPLVRRDVGNPVSGAVFSPDGDLLAWTEWGNQLRLLRVSTGKEVLGSGPYPSDGDLLFSPNGKELLTTGNDGRLHRWDVTTGKVLRGFPYPEKARRCLGLFPDGKSFLVESRAGLVVDAETGKLLRRVGPEEIHRPFAFTRSYALSRDGKTLILGEGLRTTHRDPVPRCGVVICDLATRKRTYLSGCHHGGVDHVALSPDCKRFLTAGSSDKEIHLWDTTTGRRLASLGSKGSSSVCGVGFRSDHRTGLRASWHSTEGGKWVTRVDCWNTVTGKSISNWKGPAGSTFLGFSPNGKYAAFGQWSDTLQILDSETGKVVCRFETDHSRISGLVFSNDERSVASLLANSTVLIWDIPSPRRGR
jgi:WD40 repeat protein